MESSDQGELRSLDRLKSLDSLGDVAAQLREADLLCNHMSRAEMITKWLLGKLKSEAKFRGNHDAWNTLLSAFRLLSPQKLATLLSHDVFETCRSALAVLENGQRTGIFMVLVRMFKFLIECAAGPDGTQLKAVLSVSTNQAAAFLEIWIDSMLTLAGVALLENGMGHDMLQSIFDIWSLRKRSHDEDETFAKHCLLSASRLLPVVNLYVQNQKLKRKRDDGDEPSQSNYKQMLESMLARHIFVPARTAFCKAQEAAETKGKRQVGSQHPTFLLTSMIEPLHNDNANNTGLDEGQLAVLSDLLDVAVRCHPRMTPKQRAKEKPWLDAVFAALLESMRTLNSNSIPVRDAVREMLIIAKQRDVVLSKDVLDRIIEQHSGLTAGENIDWRMISRVLEIDNTVFSEDSKAIHVLNEITRATVVQPEDPKPGEPLFKAVPLETGFMKFLRKHVVVPIMKAFADRRQLPAFVEMWAAQIKDNEKPGLVWTNVENDFAPLVEEYLTENQVLALFDQYYAAIKSAPDEPATNYDPALSSTVIVDAILAGVQSEALSDSLRDRCGELVRFMLHRGYMEPQSWNLMTKAFELWFPAWAIAQSNRDSVAQFRIKITDAPTYRGAHIMMGPHGRAGAMAAKLFIGSVSSHLRKYETDDEEAPGRSSIDAARVSYSGGSWYTSMWPILVQFPDLIVDLDGDATINRIQDCIKSAVPLATEALQAPMRTILQQASGRKVDDLVETILLYLSHTNRPELGSEDDELEESVCTDYEIAVLKALAVLSPESLSRPHREKIIDAICLQQQDDSHELPNATTAQTWRLAALNSLMKVSNATCKIAVSIEELWRLTESVVQYDSDRKPVLMLAELVVQLCKDLLATQDQERSRSMLIEMAERINRSLQFACSTGAVHEVFDADLTVIRTLLVQLEAGAKAELKSKFSYRNLENINSFLAVCLDQITTWYTNHAKDCDMANDLQPAVEALLTMPADVLQFAKRNTESWHTPLVELMKSCLAALGSEKKYDRARTPSSSMQELLVNGFCIACKSFMKVQSSVLVPLARDIAKVHLTPTQRDSFMAAFGVYVQRLQGQEYVDLLNDLLSRLRVELDTTTASVLPLVQICASHLGKANLESTESPLPPLFSSLLSLIQLDPSFVVRTRAITCVATALKGNSALANQQCIEATLLTVKKVLDNTSKAQRLFLGFCDVLSIILLQYRSRLHGRFHLVDEVLQSLLSRLFQPGMTAKHAQAVAKVVSLLCEPPPKRSSTPSVALVDEARREQGYVGQSVQYVLHHYCYEVLNGTLGPGVKEALRPGLWSIIEAMEMGDAEGIKTLSTSMNNSERAVLRGVYDDWRRFGKWHGA